MVWMMKTRWLLFVISNPVVIAYTRSMHLVKGDSHIRVMFSSFLHSLAKVLEFAIHHDMILQVFRSSCIAWIWGGRLDKRDCHIRVSFSA